MKKMGHFIDQNMNKLLLIFLFFQPAIDVITAIMLHVFKIDFTMGIILRFLFLGLMLYYLFFINQNKNKKKSLIYILIILGYMLLFSIHMIVEKGSVVFSFEMKNLIKTFYFPILLVSFYEVFQNKKNVIQKRFLKNLFIIYGLLVFIPNLLGFGFASYEVTKSGRIGLFYTANEISAILSILMPILISSVLEKKKYLFSFIVGMILIYLLTSMGTKGPLLCFFIILIFYLIKFLYENLKKKKYQIIFMAASIFLGCLFLFLLLVPKTNFYQNIRVHLEFLEVKDMKDLLKSKRVLDHFIFSQRLSFWENTNQIYKKQDLKSKLLGIGYMEYDKKTTKEMKTVEMDFVDLFYRHGILGFIIYMSSFIGISVKILKKYLKKGLIYPHKIIQTYMMSAFLAIILACFTGHVITSPSVSIFVALIFNLLYNELYKGEIQYDETRNGNS